MVFKLPKGLEKTILGLTGYLIIAGTPLLYSRTAEAQTIMSPAPNYSIYVNSFNQEVQDKYTILVGKKDTREVFLKAKKEKEPASLEILFGVNEAEEILGKKIETMNLTPLDPDFSRFVLFYPKKTKVRTEQEAYILPLRDFIKLMPFKETTFSKRIIGWGENLIDRLTPFFVFNPVKDTKDYLVESSLKKEEQTYSERAKRLEKEFGEEYAFEKIEFFKSDKLGYIERIRKIKTFFDARDLEGAAHVTALLKPAVGNSSYPERRGSGDWIEINFSIQGDKMPSWIKKKEIGPKWAYLTCEEILSSFGIKETLKQGQNEGILFNKIPTSILYYYDKNEIIGEYANSRKKRLKMKSLFLSIKKDIIKEKGFEKVNLITIGNNIVKERSSDKVKILYKGKENSFTLEDIEEFYKRCDEIESK